MIETSQNIPLVIFTSAYPYGGETTFLQNETGILVNYFAPIIFVPRIIKGEKCPLPAGAIVDESFSKFMDLQPARISRLFSTVATGMFAKEVLANFSQMKHSGNNRRMFQALFDAQMTQKWVEKKIEDSRYSGQWVFYTYWLGKYTLGIGNARKKYPQIHLISRAHRIDLYPRVNHNLYMPLQEQAIKMADKVLAVSENGRTYLRNKYSWAKNLEVSRLGVKGTEILAKNSSDGVFRIVSCSGLRPVKRVDLLARGLHLAAQIRPSQIFQWDHFGDGETRSLVELEVQKFPQNIHAHLWGQVSNETILDYYNSHSVDLFMNVSSSEGLPVSIMEAFSKGIPVLATNVGGVPEIVTQECGWLLSENPNAEKIAEAILKCIGDPGGLIQKRKAAREMWQTNYNADHNFEEFANKLKTLVS